jgi:hypothetical protein
MKKLSKLALGAIAVVLCLTSCAMIKQMFKIGPQSFQEGVGGGEWTQIAISESLSYEEAFLKIVEALGRDFDLDVTSKDGGYITTKPNYHWARGRFEMQESYRVRVLIRFNADRTIVFLKCEAEYKHGTYWMKGYDTALLEKILPEITITVG